MLGNHSHRILDLTQPFWWPCYTRRPQLTLPEWSREVGANPTRSRHCKWGAERHTGDPSHRFTDPATSRPPLRPSTWEGVVVPH